MNKKATARDKEKHHCQAHGKWGWCGNPVYRRKGKWWFCRRHYRQFGKHWRRMRKLNPKLFKRHTRGFCRRHKLLTIYGAVLAVAILTGTWLSLVLWSIPFYILVIIWKVIKIRGKYDSIRR